MIFLKILITGATSGIGYETAKVLSYMGHSVYACCHTVEELKRKNIKKEYNIQYIKLDITKEEDYKVLNNLDIDVLINQAGLGIGGSLLDLDVSKIQENFEVNVFSTLRLSKYYMEDCASKKKKGRILITSSLIGDLPVPFLGCYAATKASLTLLTKVLRREILLSNLDIDVKLILPGAYRTGFNQFMVDGISESKYFVNPEGIWKFYRKLFQMIEKKKNYSIVRKIVQATLDDSSKFIYSAPLSQRIFTKIYVLFSK